MNRLFIMLGTLFAAASVGLGAFGAHILRGNLSDYHFDIFHTGVEYQMSHALGLILVGIILTRIAHSKLIVASGWFLLIGIFLFSFSLYTIALTGYSKLGMITPFGGFAFVIGWLLLGIGALKGKV